MGIAGKKTIPCSICAKRCFPSRDYPRIASVFKAEGFMLTCIRQNISLLLTPYAHRDRYRDGLALRTDDHFVHAMRQPDNLPF